MVSTLGGTNAWGRGPAPPGKDFEHALIWCILRAKSQYLAPNFEDLSRDGCLKHFNTGCDQAVWECGGLEIRKRLTHIYFRAVFLYFLN